MLNYATVISSFNLILDVFIFHINYDDDDDDDDDEDDDYNVYDDDDVR